MKTIDFLEAKKSNAEPVAMNELAAIISDAEVLCRLYGLAEICTEVLLLAMLDNTKLSAYNYLLLLGVNIVAIKKELEKRLSNKPVVVGKKIANSVALDGLMFLNGGNRNSLKLVTTILENNNTAAARLLKQERIFLDQFRDIFYRPICE